MNKILVTGGAGYIGSCAVKVLQEAGYQPVIVDNLSRGHRELIKGYELHVGDIGDHDFLSHVFKKHEFAAVMHFAAFALVRESVQNPLIYFRNNTVGSMNLMNVMLENKVNKLIFSSTAATYGEPERIPITESHLNKPINPYGESKLAFEKILSYTSAISDLRYVTLRYFNVAGAHDSAEIGEWHDNETHIVPLAIEAVLKGKEFTVFGNDYTTKDGTCVRDYIHVADLIDAHILTLKFLEKNKENRVFNLGNGNGFSNMEVLKAVESVTKKKFKIRMGKRRPGDPAVLIASSEKIEKELGWKPKHPSIESIIESAYKWHQKSIA
jgi:UDP-glucose 4-epimerase